MPSSPLALPLALALVAWTALPAQALESAPLQQQVDEILLAHPGGTQTGPDTISWSEGAIVLTLADPAAATARSVGSCPTGSYCAYNGVSLTGSRLSFTSCPATVSLAALPGDVRSIANARSSGNVRGLSSGGSTLATVAAGGRVNSAPSGVEQLQCTT